MFTEILAPAGGQEQLTAAVRTGADAVYLGVGNFNARRNAENFAGGLEQAVRYCHGRGVRCHVTLNTLVTDHELSNLRKELLHIAACAPDAIIIQDLAVAKLARDLVPDLPRHASTQMTIHNVDGAKLAKDLGFSRVVLARELELREIEAISSAVDLEIESFIHGALCMSMSGSCYLSSILGGRSGNRGLCAQPCRLNFHDETRSCALSLKDMSFIRHIRDLHNAGVCSFKIEGRMKRPEYVAAVVTACRAALAGETPDIDSLRAVFSRSGFTAGYLTGQRTVDMFGYRRKEDVTASQAVLGQLAGLYRNEFRKIPVNMKFIMSTNQAVSLTVTDGINNATVAGPIPEAARSRATDETLVRKALEKTGGTPFLPGVLQLELDEGLAIPMQALNQLRRTALEMLLAQREVLRPWPIQTATSCPASNIRTPSETYALRARFANRKQIFLGAETVFEKIILPLGVVEQDPDLIERLGERLVVELPRVCFPIDTPKLQQRLQSLQTMGVHAVYGANPGLLHLAATIGLVCHGGPECNVLNTMALEEYALLGYQDMTLSFELAMKAIDKLGGNIPRGLVGYGYLPLMTMRVCPNSGPRGCKNGCPGHAKLTDRLGKQFLLACDERSYTILYNSTPLYIADKDIRNVDFVILYFTTEETEQCIAVTQAFQQRITPPFPRTGGLYYRELL